MDARYGRRVSEVALYGRDIRGMSPLNVFPVCVPG